jgi:hypothetical protein
LRPQLELYLKESFHREYKEYRNSFCNNHKSQYFESGLVALFVIMKLALALSFIASTAAFTPAGKMASSSTTALFQSPYENSLGVVAPTGTIPSKQCVFVS